MKKNRLGLMVVVAVALGGAGTPAAADPRSDQQSLRRQLQQLSAVLDESTVLVRGAQQALDQASRLLPGAQHRLASARSAVATAEGEYAGASAAARTAEDAAARTQAAYEGAEREVEDARVDLDRFASAAYRTGSVPGLGFVVGAQSLGDLTTGIEIIRREGKDRSAALSALSMARLYAARLRAGAQARRVLARRSRTQTADLLTLRRSAQVVAADAERSIAGLVSARDTAVRAARSAQAAEQARYADLQAQSDAAAARLRAAAAAARRATAPVAQSRLSTASPTGAAARPSSGQLLWPVAGIVTSPFGYRLDPVFGVWRLHAGLDIAAPGGAPIAAPAGGVVVNAGWAGGYGNYMCISHGDRAGRNLATCYAHQSAGVVRAGQRVGAGQLIGLVGTTGASTGNHLHFAGASRWCPGRSAGLAVAADDVSSVGEGSGGWMGAPWLSPSVTVAVASGIAPRADLRTAPGVDAPHFYYAG